jgi:galactokinase
MTGIKSELHNEFRKWAGHAEIMISAPGRANIIGEHTDYNQGWVMPFNIDRYVHFLCSYAEDEHSIIRSRDFKDDFLYGMHYPVGSWQHFFTKIFEVLEKYALQPGPFKMIFGSDLPIGAGMSSSSAVICGALECLDRLFGWKLKAIDKVNMASEVEHGAGVKGGKMDQYSIFFSQQNHATLLDCQKMEHEYIPIPDSWCFFILHSGQTHNLAHTEYNLRRQECESVVEMIPGISSLRDMTSEILERYQTNLEPKGYLRAKFVIEENKRVHKMKNAMLQQDMDAACKLLSESHKGLSREYEVSTTALDYIVEKSLTMGISKGCRLMGGGFGGGTIHLNTAIDEDKITRLQKEYFAEFRLELKLFKIQSSDGLIWA